MQARISHRILMTGLKLGLGVLLAASMAAAQQSAPALKEWDLYCSGLPTTQRVPTDTYIISGENASYMVTYYQGREVFLNRGAAQGVRAGDAFEVIRPVSDPLKAKWFRWQTELMRAMGTMYADIGRIRVVSVQPRISVAQIELSCGMIQRGDIARPFAARPAPPLHNVPFDRYVLPGGNKKGMAMVVTGKGFTNAVSAGEIVYVNLGSAQGVMIGSYFRIFRYQGSRNETVYQVPRMEYEVEGLGRAPVPYSWDSLPPEMLGEGIVLRTGPNSSAVMLTTSREVIMAGDYAQLE